jgi:hypothetical protein
MRRWGSQAHPQNFPTLGALYANRAWAEEAQAVAAQDDEVAQALARQP